MITPYHSAEAVAQRAHSILYVTVLLKLMFSITESWNEYRRRGARVRTITARKIADV